MKLVKNLIPFILRLTKSRLRNKEKIFLSYSKELNEFIVVKPRIREVTRYIN